MSSWKDNLRTIEPYVPGEQPDLPDMIKLNTNENPYPPSPKVQEVLDQYDINALRLYPDPNSQHLVDAIAEYNGLNSDQVFVGVGSDDVLAIAFMTFFNSKKPILFPDITYSFYDVWAELFQIPYVQKPLDDHFEFVRSDYYGENGGIVIANPNAPTGVVQELDALRDIIDHNRDVVVIIDEAYVDFSDHSALELIKEYDNVLIVQTYSKSRSLAGHGINPLCLSTPIAHPANRKYESPFSSHILIKSLNTSNSASCNFLRTFGSYCSFWLIVFFYPF